MSAQDEDLADLFVLGALDPAEQAAVERRLGEEPALRAAVLAAARRLAPLDDTAAPVPLPEGAWDRLAARVAALGRTSLAAPAPAPPIPANANRRPWAAALAVAALLLLAVGALWTLQVRGPAAPAAVAVLLDPDGAPFALVEAFEGGDAAVVALADYAVPEGRALQVWTKWSEAVGPVSLGVLDALASAPVGADGLPAPVAGQLYEITLEAEGGSATGRPTGPILGVGLARIPG